MNVCPPWCARVDNHGPTRYLPDFGRAALVEHETPVLAPTAGVPVLVRRTRAVWSDGVVVDDEGPRVVVELDPTRDFTAPEARELAAALVTAADVLEQTPVTARGSCGPQLPSVATTVRRTPRAPRRMPVEGVHGADRHPLIHRAARGPCISAVQRVRGVHRQPIAPNLFAQLR